MPHFAIRSSLVLGVLCAALSTFAQGQDEPIAGAATKPDTRPKERRLVDHGRFTSKDISVNPLQWMTPDGKYRLDLKDIDPVPGEAHRYEISGLPPRFILHLGFAVKCEKALILGEAEALERILATKKLSANVLLQNSGVRRIHIHLATMDGLVLASQEFDTQESFGFALPNYGKFPQGHNGLVTEGSKTGWTFGANTASGAAFVVKADTSYVLEITIIEVDEKMEKRKPLRPIIQS
jgi:hypothetical protein